MLNNLASHGAEACQCLVEHKVLPAVVPVLKVPDVDLLDLTLTFLEMMLKASASVRHIPWWLRSVGLVIML